MLCFSSPTKKSFPESRSSTGTEGVLWQSVFSAKKYNSICNGIILLASYLNSDISDTTLKVLSIYGSNDEILNMDKYEENKKYAPEIFIERRIDGGIHSYFGSYGIQNKDGKPYIEKSFQIEKTKDYILEFINN